MATSSSSSSLPVGYRFHPTEEELVNHYLKKKIHGKDFNDVIPEVDICSREPSDLPGLSRTSSDDEWYYFSRPEYKSGKNKGRANRATERGFWKITGRDREIKARESKAVIGKKRTLTFYTGKVRSGQKTCWVIHEYYIPETLLPDAATQRDFVLCRLKKKDESTDVGACDEGEPNTNNASDFHQNLMEVFGRQSIPENLQITLPDDTWPEEMLASLIPSLESPQYDYSVSAPRDRFLHANAGSDDCLELQPFGHDDSEDEELFVDSIFDWGDHSLEETSRTTFLNHSSEPKSLHKVYDEGLHQQGMSSSVASSLSIRDKMPLNMFVQKNASSVNVSANLPRNIGHVQSVHLEESKSNARYVLQAGGFSSVTHKSSLNESGGRKGDMVATGSGPALPLRPDDYIPQRRLEAATAQSSRAHPKPACCPLPKLQGMSAYKPKKPQAPKLQGMSAYKPMEPPRPPRNDEGKGMKQEQTGTTITDWKSSFIVWKEAPLSLGSYPRIVYIRNMIGGLFMFLFFLEELFSYGTWYTS